MAPNDSDVLYEGSFATGRDIKALVGADPAAWLPVYKVDLQVTEAGIISDRFKLAAGEIADVWRAGHQRLVLSIERDKESLEVEFCSTKSAARFDILEFRSAIFQIKPELAKSPEEAPQLMADILVVAEELKPAVQLLADIRVVAKETRAAIQPIVVLAWIHLTFLVLAVVAGVIVALSAGD